MDRTKDIPNILMTIREASLAISISSKTIRILIRSGSLRAINLGIRMTRISLHDLISLAEGQGYQVEIPSSLTSPYSSLTSSLSLYNMEDNKKGSRETTSSSKPETGNVNRKAKCRKTPKAGELAPDGVSHDTHYTMAEVLSAYDIKYGRFYEIRNRYQLKSVHAWGTTCFLKEDVDKAVTEYLESQGGNLSNDWYTCFDIMKLYGLGKTQVRRFAQTHGVRIKQVKGGRANYYLKADWEAARKKARKISVCTKLKRQ